jgi:hypothetical protein
MSSPHFALFSSRRRSYSAFNCKQEETQREMLRKLCDISYRVFCEVEILYKRQKLNRTVKSSDFEPCESFALFFRKGLERRKRFLQQKRGKWKFEKKFQTATWFYPFCFVLNTPTRSTGRARKCAEFP